jgi:predicted TIM-barrel fold metal-dependent hydrolase
MYIDADAHVDECSETWSYIPASKANFRPGEMVFKPGEAPPYLSAGTHNDGLEAMALFIDGQVFYRRQRSDELTNSTAAIRELRDVPARVKKMDEMGVETQVIFPSTLLNEITHRQEVEIAVCESYNRWLGDRCRESNGRLQWAAILPLRSMPDALKELHRVKEDGAVAIFKRSLETDLRPAGDEYFHPIYAAAQDLDMPICIHKSGPYVGYTPSFTTTQNDSAKFTILVLDAFVSLMLTRTVAKFPNLRFGFIESGSGWVAHALYESNFDQHEKLGAIHDPGAREALAHYEDALDGTNLFVTCETAEDLPLIISQLGTHNLVIGTDYGHSDRSALILAHGELESMPTLSDEAKKNITDLNARRLYALK